MTAGGKLKRCLGEIMQKTTVGKYLLNKRHLHKVVYSYLIPQKLVKRAEQKPDLQSKLLAERIKKCPEKAATLQHKIDDLLQHIVLSPERKQTLEQDMLYYYFAYGYTPNEYICYEFENKTLEERRAFVSDRESVCFGYRVNERNGLRMFSDKMKTYECLEPYFKREAIAISSKKDFEKFCNFIKKHTRVVKKVVSESCGRSVELIDVTREDHRKLFNDFLSQGKIILEEPITSHQSLAVLNSSSVNTVRCCTVNTTEGLEIPWCFMKIGRAGSFVDNGGAGGIFVGIDPETGVFNTDGYNEMNNRFICHPDSGIHLQGFQLPEWEEMLRICREMAQKVPHVAWIGWDMAYSQSGWVVVEGNSLTEAIAPQLTSKKGIRKDLLAYQNRMKAFYPPAGI